MTKINFWGRPSLADEKEGSALIAGLNEHVDKQEHSYPSKGRFVYDRKGKGKKKVKVKTLSKSKRKIFMSFGGYRSEVKLGEQKQGMSLSSCYKYVKR